MTIVEIITQLFFRLSRSHALPQSDGKIIVEKCHATFWSDSEKMTGIPNGKQNKLSSREMATVLAAQYIEARIAI